MKIKCDSCGMLFESETGDWRGFINEAKDEGWVFVKDEGEWLRFDTEKCRADYFWD